LNPKIPVDLETVILKAMAKSRDERYTTARAFAEDLSRFLDGKPTIAKPPSVANRAAKWVRRHSKIVAAAVAVCLMATAGLAISTLLIAREKTKTEENFQRADAYFRRARETVDHFGVRLNEKLAGVPGAEGVRRVAENAVLNANYLRVKLRDAYHVPYDRMCMHEFVCNNRKQKEHGIHALDVAKRLIDLGYHPMTIYFPLVVSEAMMIEPTETESKETLDAFVEDMLLIAEEARTDPEKLHAAPVTRPIGRLDEGRAVRDPQLRWTCRKG